MSPTTLLTRTRLGRGKQAVPTQDTEPDRTCGCGPSHAPPVLLLLLQPHHRPGSTDMPILQMRALALGGGFKENQATAPLSPGFKRAAAPWEGPSQPPSCLSSPAPG